MGERNNRHVTIKKKNIANLFTIIILQVLQSSSIKRKWIEFLKKHIQTELPISDIKRCIDGHNQLGYTFANEMCC